MKQAPRFDSLPFDPFSLFQNDLATPEVDIGRGELLQTLVVASVVVVIDECIDLLSEITGQVVVFQQAGGTQGSAICNLQHRDSDDCRLRLGAWFPATAQRFW